MYQTVRSTRTDKENVRSYVSDDAQQGPVHACSVRCALAADHLKSRADDGLPSVRASNSSDRVGLESDHRHHRTRKVHASRGCDDRESHRSFGTEASESNFDSRSERVLHQPSSAVGPATTEKRSARFRCSLCACPAPYAISLVMTGWFWRSCACLSDFATAYRSSWNFSTDDSKLWIVPSLRVSWSGIVGLKTRDREVVLMVTSTRHRTSGEKSEEERRRRRGESDQRPHMTLATMTRTCTHPTHVCHTRDGGECDPLLRSRRRHVCSVAVPVGGAEDRTSGGVARVKPETAT